MARASPAASERNDLRQLGFVVLLVGLGADDAFTSAFEVGKSSVAFTMFTERVGVCGGFAAGGRKRSAHLKIGSLTRFENLSLVVKVDSVPCLKSIPRPRIQSNRRTMWDPDQGQIAVRYHGKRSVN